MNEFMKHISQAKNIHVQQVWEGLEMVFGFETRNKYQILDDELRPLAFAAEQSKGILGTILRQIVGHWRAFEIIIFDERREKVFKLDFPFRFFFKSLYVTDFTGNEIGHLKERFAFFRKKFDVYDSNNQLVARINSSFFKLWTFEFFDGQRSLGKVQKKWSGILGEVFTDKDNFVVSYSDPNLPTEVRTLMLATCLMVDIVYFENNQGKRSLID